MNNPKVTRCFKCGRNWVHDHSNCPADKLSLEQRANRLEKRIKKLESKIQSGDSVS